MNDEERKNHSYLGDGVYAEKTHDYIILRTGDHRDSMCDNKIYLEDSVLTSFLRFIKNFDHKKNK